MLNIIDCIVREHDPLFFAFAVLVCVGGCACTALIFGRARGTSGLQQLGWVFLAALAAGSTIWNTHFLAMIAYQPGTNITLDPMATLLSLVIAISGTAMGFGLATWKPSRLLQIAGGAVVGAAISAMHYMGMAAYGVDGLMIWDQTYVAASITAGVIFAAAALGMMGMNIDYRWRAVGGTGLMVLAIASMHFTAMTALDIIPLRLSADPLDATELQVLGMATALVGFLVVCAGVAAALIDRQTKTDSMRRLHKMAHSDGLTGLPNRASFQDELRRRIDGLDNGRRKLACIAIDLNRFKEINDLHGHKAGDDVLVTLAGRLREQAGGGAMVARIGGDEFVALLEYADHVDLVGLVNQIHTALHTPIVDENMTLPVGASIGVATYPDDADSADALSTNADLAMYRAKRSATGDPQYYDRELDEAVRLRREMAADLRHAVEHDELDLHFQVQTRVNDQSISGFEALLRWHHPRYGNIPPSDFIPIAEESGLILQLGEWALQRACEAAAGWKSGHRVAVNMSAKQLASSSLPQTVHQVLLDTGLPPHRLEIELTESAIMSNRDQALHVLRQIKALGVGVALDDFGTGYSSLETLRLFPFDKIKLDRFFISDLGRSPQSTAIIRAVLALGKSLAIPILAEGIETREQLHMLEEEGCDEAQGFLIGRPAPIHENPAFETPGAAAMKRLQAMRA